jgi:dipeptidyl aminopeptidase/acylaminoacyl peptidase
MCKETTKKIFQCLLLVVVFISLCIAGPVAVKGEKEARTLVQDLGKLEDSNGKIVYQKLIRIKSKWSDEVECYRIKYLSDGLKVVGFLLKPKGEDLKFPVMIYNRGGNREFGKITEESLIYLSFLASNNYIVLASQYRGNDGGQGREEFGGKDVNDVLNLIPLAKSLPFTEPDKIVMYGISRGGMMTYLAIKEGADIKAAAVVGGVTDLVQTYKEREEGMKKVITELVGINRDNWKKRSVYYWPEKINIPVLILHGENDRKVKVSQAKKLSEKLREAGKPHKLVIFPKGGHVLDTHSGDRNRIIFNWFNYFFHAAKMAKKNCGSFILEIQRGAFLL